MQEIRIEKTKNPKQKCDVAKVGFGTVFTDHMFVMNYKDGKWQDPRIVPFGPFSISPAATVLHYAPEIFEGLKAYRTPAGHIQMFRPIENIRRMNNSAERMCLPKMDENMFMEALKTLVTVEKDWVPREPYTSLYIRPVMFGTDAKLGVHAPKEVTFCIILSPVGPYFKEGMNPVKMLIEKDDVRAVRGGTGFAKCGGNYAASLRAGERAEEEGYSQVLWLDAVEKKYIEEGGGLNVMFKVGGKGVTPMLNGAILPGVTRKSLIDIMKRDGIPCEERLISLDEIAKAVKDGKLEECWCCGTAAVVGPIGELLYDGKTYRINDFKTGPMAQRLYDELTDIQWGKKPDPFGWTVPVC